MRNKRLAVLILALIIVIVAAAYMYPTLKKAYVGETINVLVANNDIGDGMVLKENMFTMTEMPADYVGNSDDYVKPEELATDRFAKQIILKGEPLIHRKITNDDELGLYSEKNLVAVSVGSLASVVGAKMSVGDHVIVRGFIEKENHETGERKREVYAPVELSNMEIAYLVDAKAEDTGLKTKEAGKEDEKKEEKVIPANVVFKVKNKEQAEKLIELEYTAKIHLERLSDKEVKRLEKERRDAEKALEDAKKTEAEVKKAEGAGQ